MVNNLLIVCVKKSRRKIAAGLKEAGFIDVTIV